MGLDLLVPRSAPPLLLPVLSRLAAEGFTCTVRMVDGQLHPPNAEPPATWREVRLHTPAGMITVRRVPAGLELVIFGNADAALREAQQRLAFALDEG